MKKAVGDDPTAFFRMSLFYRRWRLFLLAAPFTGSFGCLQGVDLLSTFLEFPGHVRCNCAFTNDPTTGWIGINFTVLTGWVFNDLIAADTAFNNRTTTAVHERTAVLGHERTFNTFFNSLTQHISTSTILRKKIPPEGFGSLTDDHADVKGIV